MPKFITLKAVFLSFSVRTFIGVVGVQVDVEFLEVTVKTQVPECRTEEYE